MKLLIFDFDGTLADTGKVILLTLEQTLRQLGQKIPPPEELKTYIGMPLAEIFKFACKSQDKILIDEAVRIYRSNFPENCKNNISLYPGVRETLNILQNDKILLSIASSRDRNSLLSLIELLNIRSYFSIIVGEQDVHLHKPDPEIANLILKKSDISANKAMLIGDTIFDIKTGIAASIKTCGVSYGNHTKEELLEAGANYIINKFPELLNIVQENS